MESLPVQPARLAGCVQVFLRVNMHGRHNVDHFLGTHREAG